MTWVVCRRCRGHDRPKGCADCGNTGTVWRAPRARVTPIYTVRPKPTMRLDSSERAKRAALKRRWARMSPAKREAVLAAGRKVIARLLRSAR